MAATPTSAASRRASSIPVSSPGRCPERSFTVTGSPLPSWAARASATARSGSSRSDAPAPVFTTFRTGQPMLMSIMSAPCSAAIAAASRITSGSCPKSWIGTGCSSGWMRRNSDRVRRSPYFRPKLDTISLNASPAPCRRAWSRTNQLPIPASGASTSRFGMRWPPRVQGSVSVRMGTRLALVPVPDEPQPREREEVVYLVDLLAERRDRRGEPPGCDGGRLVAQLVADAAHDAVDAAGEAVHHAGPDSREGVAADRRLGLAQLHLRELRRA